MPPRSLAALAGLWRAAEQLDATACASVANGDADGAFHAARLLVALLRQLRAVSALWDTHDALLADCARVLSERDFLRERLRSLERLTRPVSEFVGNPMRVQ